MNVFHRRENFSSGAPWEDIVGYSRAVKVGNLIEISGTTAAEADGIATDSDPYIQTKKILLQIQGILDIAGAGMQDVVRTRIYTTNINFWESIGKAHGEFFGKIKPAATMIEVAALIHPSLLVEIEVTAIISEK